MCVKGGAISSRDYNLKRTVVGVALKTGNRDLIGWDWDTNVTDGEASTSIGIGGPAFSPIQISGSLSIHPQDRASGGIGRDKHTPRGFPASFEPNLVNTYWEGKARQRFEGNAGAGLWHMPQNRAFPDFVVYYRSTVSCARFFGC